MSTPQKERGGGIQRLYMGMRCVSVGVSERDRERERDRESSVGVFCGLPNSPYSHTTSIRTMRERNLGESAFRASLTGNYGIWLKS